MFENVQNLTSDVVRLVLPKCKQDGDLTCFPLVAYMLTCANWLFFHKLLSLLGDINLFGIFIDIFNLFSCKYFCWSFVGIVIIMQRTFKFHFFSFFLYSLFRVSDFSFTFFMYKRFSFGKAGKWYLFPNIYLVGLEIIPFSPTIHSS